MAPSQVVPKHMCPCEPLSEPPKVLRCIIIRVALECSGRGGAPVPDKELRGRGKCVILQRMIALVAVTLHAIRQPESTSFAKRLDTAGGRAPLGVSR